MPARVTDSASLGIAAAILRQAGVLNKIIPGIEKMLAAGGFDPPPPPDEAQPIAIIR